MHKGHCKLRTGQLSTIPAVFAQQTLLSKTVHWCNLSGNTNPRNWPALKWYVLIWPKRGRTAPFCDRGVMSASHKQEESHKHEESPQQKSHSERESCRQEEQ